MENKKEGPRTRKLRIDNLNEVNLVVLGRELRAARSHRKITQDQLREQIGVSRKKVIDAENGEYLYELAELLKLHTVLYPWETTWLEIFKEYMLVVGMLLTLRFRHYQQFYYKPDDLAGEIKEKINEIAERLTLFVEEIRPDRK